jgi:transposase
MTYDRLCHWDIVNLSVKTEDVAAYIKKFSREFRGYSLIMDNAKVHKTHEVSEAVASVGLIPIFLPPYTPQLNPI